ncbi:calmodulin, putative [Ixodes scapularis]|uniref:Calmodulin, putative n=1 Tax=Ixodes scapularis TaxID=6945 RepID=B7PZE1_IXOSC|nr:calmodulin, putative [Ixodes scapularis]|eukprot:XP_002405159.1 calmodulin, putative [Ixodes scapularis]
MDLTPEEIADIKGAFLLFDRNGDGTISTTELEMVLRAMGERPSPSQLARIVRQIDSDRNGSIDFQEFLFFMAGRISHKGLSKSAVLKAFQLFDRDGNGYITREELVHIFTHVGQSMSQEDAEKIIREVDVDKDGKIHYTELVNKVLPTKKQKEETKT